MAQLTLNVINAALMAAVVVLICLQTSPEGEPLTRDYQGLALAAIAISTCALWNLVSVTAQLIFGR